MKVAASTSRSSTATANTPDKYKCFKPSRRVNFRYDRERDNFESGAPDRNRTCNLLIRSQVLYPIELRAHALFFNELGESGKVAECPSVK